MIIMNCIRSVDCKNPTHKSEVLGHEESIFNHEVMPAISL